MFQIRRTPLSTSYIRREACLKNATSVRKASELGFGAKNSINDGAEDGGRSTGPRGVWVIDTSSEHQSFSDFLIF
jgi:hypothetical protein